MANRMCSGAKSPRSVWRVWSTPCCLPANVAIGAGKPAPSAFRAALDRLNVKAASAVFVGDDPRTDIEGAAAVGMKTIHVTSYFGEDERCGAAGCRIHVRRLDLIPAIAEQLVPVRTESHVA